MNTLSSPPIPSVSAISTKKNIKNVNNQTIFTPGTKIVGAFKTKDTTVKTYYTGKIAPNGYNKKNNTYAVMFDDGDYRSEFNAIDVSVYDICKLTKETIHHTKSSPGIGILNVNQESVNAYSQTLCLNKVIKHIKGGNIKPNGNLSPTPDNFKIIRALLN